MAIEETRYRAVFYVCASAKDHILTVNCNELATNTMHGAGFVVARCEGADRDS
jgi:hypothetical protein